MTPMQFQKKIIKYVDENGGVNATARKLSVSSAYISQVYGGHKVPSDLMLNEMGYTKNVKITINYEEAKS